MDIAGLRYIVRSTAAAGATRLVGRHRGRPTEHPRYAPDPGDRRQTASARSAPSPASRPLPSAAYGVTAATAATGCPA